MYNFSTLYLGWSSRAGKRQQKPNKKHWFTLGDLGKCVWQRASDYCYHHCHYHCPHHHHCPLVSIRRGGRAGANVCATTRLSVIYWQTTHMLKRPIVFSLSNDNIYRQMTMLSLPSSLLNY